MKAEFAMILQKMTNQQFLWWSGINSNACFLFLFLLITEFQIQSNLCFELSKDNNYDFHSQEGYRGHGICDALYCYAPEKQKCFAHAAHRAFDGTTCGSQKWCYYGYCGHDPRATVIPDQNSKINTIEFFHLK